MKTLGEEHAIREANQGIISWKEFWMDYWKDCGRDIREELIRIKRRQGLCWTTFGGNACDALKQMEMDFRKDFWKEYWKTLWRDIWI